MTLSEAQQAWEDLKQRLETEGFLFALYYIEGESGHYNPGVRLELTEKDSEFPSVTLIPELNFPGLTPAQKAAKVLNEALALDPEATRGLAQHYVLTNTALAEHPTIQVHQDTDTSPTQLRLVGMLNGILLTLNPEEVLVYVIDDDTQRITRFTTKPYRDFQHQ